MHLGVIASMKKGLEQFIYREVCALGPARCDDQPVPHEAWARSLQSAARMAMFAAGAPGLSSRVSH